MKTNNEPIAQDEGAPRRPTLFLALITVRNENLLIFERRWKKKRVRHFAHTTKNNYDHFSDKFFFRLPYKDTVYSV